MVMAAEQLSRRVPPRACTARELIRHASFAQATLMEQWHDFSI